MGISTPSFLRTVNSSLALAWKHSRLWAVILVVATLVSALLPAVEVYLVRRLTEALGSGDKRLIVFLVILTAIAMGLLSSLFEVLWALRDALSRSVGGASQIAVNHAMARLTPELLADPEATQRAQAAREAAGSSVSGLPGQFILSFRAILTAVSVVIALWPASPLGAILLVASLLPLMLLSPWVAKIKNSAFRRRVKANRRANYLSEQLAYQRTATELASLGTSHRVAEMASGLVKEVVDIDLSATARSTGINLLGTAASAVLTGVALWLVIVGSGNPASGVAAAVVAFLSAGESVSTAGYSFSELIGQAGPAASYFDFIREVPAEQLGSTSAQPVDVLKVNDVYYRYPGSERDALSGVSLTAQLGEVVAIVGVNGAGKTTLVNNILGASKPASGSILIDGISLSEYSEAERLAIFALLTQEFGRYELTVREALMLGTQRDDVTDDELWQALRFARADRFVQDLPQGLETQLGQQWKGVGLSGGQWQRLALARIRLRNSPIWLLDEPTSAVDAETEAEIFNDLTHDKAGRITLVVSHRATTLRRMDRIYVIDASRIVQCGTYSELINVPGRFAQIFSDPPEPVASSHRKCERQ